jgi:Fe-S-cluster containining protein
MQCRSACGACCIAPSIAAPFYGMPHGKPAGVPCVHLDAEMRCGLFGDPRRPALCAAYVPDREFCGDDRQQALVRIELLERQSTPSGESL